MYANAKFFYETYKIDINQITAYRYAMQKDYYKTPHDTYKKTYSELKAYTRRNKVVIYHAKHF